MRLVSVLAAHFPSPDRRNSTTCPSNLSEAVDCNYGNRRSNYKVTQVYVKNKLCRAGETCLTAWRSDFVSYASKGRSDLLIVVHFGPNI